MSYGRAFLTAAVALYGLTCAPIHATEADFEQAAPATGSLVRAGAPAQASEAAPSTETSAPGTGARRALQAPGLAAWAAAAADKPWRAEPWHAERWPVDRLSNAGLEELLDSDYRALGSLSLGRTNAGALINAVQMPTSEHWQLVVPAGSWGSAETVEYLRRAITFASAQHAPTHKLYVGHLSLEHGGRMWPHRSHQSGRDVDLSYYYRVDKNPCWYQRATERSLDVARSWSLIRALVTETDVEMMFINTSVQKLLKRHALAIGEDAAWLDTIFQYRSREPAPLIRHAWGHETHIHVRFYNPQAQGLASRLYEPLVARRVIKPRNPNWRWRTQRARARLRAAKGSGAAVQEGGVEALGALRAKGAVAQVPLREMPPRRLPPTGTSDGSSGATASLR